MTPLPDATRAAIEPFLAEWGLPEATGRVGKRVATPIAGIEAFYAAMLPWMEEILNYLNQFPLDAIPDQDRRLAAAALAMCEVDNPVRWKETELSSGFDVRGMIEKEGFYDSRIPA